MARKARAGRPPIPARLRKTRRLHILLTADEHKRLTEYARERGTTVSESMRAQLRSLIERKED